MAESHFKPPSSLNLIDGNLSEQFRKWNRQMEIYMEASGVKSKKPKAQTAIILHCAGPQAIEVFDQLEFGEEESRDDPTTVLNKLKEYCNPRSNEVLQRYRFWNCNFSQPFDKFVTELRTQAEQCNFQEKEKMIRDKIVFSVPKHLKEKLLRETDLTLKKALDICQAYEQTVKHVEEMDEKPKTDQKIENVSGNIKQKKSNKTFDRQTKPECRYCGYRHDFSDRKKCPAWGRRCSRCSGLNHFKEKCKTRVHAVNKDESSSEDDEFDDKWLKAVTKVQNSNGKTCLLEVNKNKVRFQIDTAADVNTICQRFVKKTQAMPTKTRLVMWNKTKMVPKGEAKLLVTNPKTKKTHRVSFVIVDNTFNCLLGLQTLKELGFVTFNEEKYVANISSQNDLLGNLGEAHLTVNPEIRPCQKPCRKVQFALQDKVKTELENLIERGILERVDEPTEWVSQMAVVEKSNGKVRICIDPRPLNEALMREHHKLSTLDDVLPKFKNAKIFTKLDVKEAFWHIKLDTKSSFLTTMNTPIGRVRWTRLPFGLNVSSEIFQKHLSVALQGLEGIVNVADDIMIIGSGTTTEEAMKNHDENYENLKKRCQDKDIRLNEEKTREREDSVIFMGHKISERGIEPDSKKIEAILKMKTPDDVHDVKRFCGMVQYLARFLPQLSDMLKPLRDLTKKDREFSWNKECEISFKKVKETITAAPVLVYFDDDKDLELQVDSSQDGLGAVLMQDGKPIEFASRALTETEQRWAQIEKEMLAIVYGLERFDQYTYGRKVYVTTDHKPLEMIIKKSLSEVPRRLQRLLMRCSRYDIDLKWEKGSSLVIADTLSRATINEVVAMSKDTSELHVDVKSHLPDQILNKIKLATQTDKNLKILKDIIVNGWPQHKSEAPAEVLPFYDIRDTLSVEDELIVKGERVLIPKSLRKEIKDKLHAAHMATDSMIRRARRTVFWPGMADEIKQIAENCEICQETKRSNQKETLRQHEKGSKCWEKVGTDLFQIKGRDYLILVDYFSNFIEVDYLPNPNATTVISKLKSHFSRHGSPKVLVSDCGPQYTSKEFKEFTARWGISHVTSAPGHHQANGKAESAVKTVKTMMKRCLQENEDQYEALLELRNTPRQDGYSPAELVFKSEPRTLLPRFNDYKRLTKCNSNRDKTIKTHFDKSARDMPDLTNNQAVYFQNPEKTKWEPGVVLEKVSGRSYKIEGENGGKYIRNRLHLRNKSTPFNHKTSREIVNTERQYDKSSLNMQTNADHRSLNSQPNDSSTNHNYTTRHGRRTRPNPKYM